MSPSGPTTDLPQACPNLAFWMPRVGGIYQELLLSEMIGPSSSDEEKIFSLEWGQQLDTTATVTLECTLTKAPGWSRVPLKANKQTECSLNPNHPGPSSAQSPPRCFELENI